MGRALLVLVLAVVAGVAPAGAQRLDVRLQQALDRVSDVVAESFARSLPLPSASAGVAYSFDPVTGNFQREPSTFGQVYLDRSDTLGAKRWNVSFAYQYQQLDELDGKSVDPLRDDTPIYVPGKALALTLPSLAIDAGVHQFLFAATYGFTEDLEASIAMPIVYSDIALRSDIRLAGVTETTGTLESFQLNVVDDRQIVGAGDLLLRTKYRLLERHPVGLAATLMLRIPTGDQDDLQGIGFVELTPGLAASTRVFQPARWARFQGHLNAGLGFNADDVSSSEARWGIGVDWGITDTITAAVAVLGRNQFAKVAPAGFFAFPRCRSDLDTCAIDRSVRNGNAPLFGLSRSRPDYYDVSIGGRGAVWRDTLFAFVNVVVPLNDGYVRTEPIPLVGLEATF